MAMGWGKWMKLPKLFFRLEHNKQRWYVTACEWGPYRDVDEALAAAEVLNQKLKQARKRANDEFKRQAPLSSKVM
jgi:hypothetical protein